jgi:hypothetical protein
MVEGDWEDGWGPGHVHPGAHGREVVLAGMRVQKVRPHDWPEGHVTFELVLFISVVVVFGFPRSVFRFSGFGKIELR